MFSAFSSSQEVFISTLFAKYIDPLPSFDKEMKSSNELYSQEMNKLKKEIDVCTFNTVRFYAKYRNVLVDSAE